MRLRRWLMAGCLIGSSVVYGTSLGVATPVRIFARNGIVAIEEDKMPLLKDDRVLVPLNYIMDAFGASCEIDESTNQAIVKGDGRQVIFNIGSREYKHNVENKMMDVEPLVANGTVYVPIKYAFEVFETDVDWDNRNKVVYVDRDAKQLTDKRQFEYGIGGKVYQFSDQMDGGLSVIAGGLYRGEEKGSLLEIGIPGYYEISGLNEVVRPLVGEDLEIGRLLDFKASGKVRSGRIEGKQVDYEVSHGVDDSLYIKIYSKQKLCPLSYVDLVDGEGKKIEVAGLGAYEEEGKVYVPLISTAKETGVKLQNSCWQKVVQFDNGLEIDVCNGEVVDGLEVRELEVPLVVRDNLVYMALEEFNKEFKTEIHKETRV